MGDTLFERFRRDQKNRLGQTVKGKADEIALKMDINFKCSNQWLQSFKNTHNITWHSVTGEGASAE
jgi:hypothetical protein